MTRELTSKGFENVHVECRLENELCMKNVSLEQRPDTICHTPQEYISCRVAMWEGWMQSGCAVALGH